MSSALYGGAYLLLIAGVSYLAYLSHIPESYIVAIAMIMLGIAVVSGMESASGTPRIGAGRIFSRAVPDSLVGKDFRCRVYTR